MGKALTQQHWRSPEPRKIQSHRLEVLELTASLVDGMPGCFIGILETVAQEAANQSCDFNDGQELVRCPAWSYGGTKLGPEPIPEFFVVGIVSALA